MQILALAESGGCFRFVLCGIADSRPYLRITVNNFTSQMQTSTVPLRRVLSVKFVECQQISTKELDEWLTKFEGQRMFFHEDELQDVTTALHKNHTLLPAPYNKFRDRLVSFIQW